jgi:ubiquinone biosynthesis protein COQ9
MKKLLLIPILTVLFSLQSSSQNYDEDFDRLDNTLNNGNGYSSSDNLGAALGWHESYIMMSYLKMYEATKDTKYLIKCIN